MSLFSPDTSLAGGQLWLEKGLISLLRLRQLTSLERQRPSLGLHHSARRLLRLGALAALLLDVVVRRRSVAAVKFRFSDTLELFPLKSLARWTQTRGDTSPDKADEVTTHSASGRLNSLSLMSFNRLKLVHTYQNISSSSVVVGVLSRIFSSEWIHWTRLDRL